MTRPVDIVTRPDNLQDLSDWELVYYLRLAVRTWFNEEELAIYKEAERRWLPACQDDQKLTRGPNQ